MAIIEKAVVLGGGLQEDDLALATATESDVLSGKTFYAGGEGLKTGTYVSPFYTPTGKVLLSRDINLLGSFSYSTERGYASSSITNNVYGDYQYEGRGGSSYDEMNGDFANTINTGNYTKVRFVLVPVTNETYTYVRVGGSRKQFSYTYNREVVYDVAVNTNTDIKIGFGQHASANNKTLYTIRLIELTN